jgi:hypothetical protein
VPFPQGALVTSGRGSLGAIAIWTDMHRYKLGTLQVSSSSAPAPPECLRLIKRDDVSRSPKLLEVPVLCPPYLGDASFSCSLSLREREGVLNKLAL